MKDKKVRIKITIEIDGKVGTVGCMEVLEKDVKHLEEVKGKLPHMPRWKSVLEFIQSVI